MKIKTLSLTSSAIILGLAITAVATYERVAHSHKIIAGSGFSQYDRI